MSGPVDTTRGAAELLAQKALKSGGPTAVTFQVTDRCHFDCVHCYETHGQEAELSLEDIDRILGEIAREGSLFLTLTGGEFFMRRDADDILRAARKHRFSVKLLTTGWHVDERRADLIAQLGSIQVDLSFYSGRPETHDLVTQIRGSWQRTVAAARRLRARKVLVVLKTPILGLNADEVDSVLAAARELDCPVTFDPKLTGRQDGDLGPTRQRPTDAALKRFYTHDGAGIWPVLAEGWTADSDPSARNRLDETPCRAAQDVVGINPQGLVSACHTIPEWGGDLTKESFHAVWRHSPLLVRMRKLTWGDLEECNRCDVRPYCNRCHGMALFEDGKLAGPSREACRHAVLLRELLVERGLSPPTPPDGAPLPPPLARDASRLRPAALRVIG